MKYTLCVLIMWLSAVSGMAWGQDAAKQTKTVTVEASVVDAQGKTMWSLRLATILYSWGNNQGGGQLFPSKDDVASAGGFRMHEPAEMSQAVETTGPATTRPVKWVGKRELSVQAMEIAEGGAIRVRLSLIEKIPTGLADAMEYASAGVTTSLVVENGKRVILGGDAEHQFVLKVTVEK